MAIVIKSRAEIESMRRAGRILAELLQALSREVRVGMKTRDLDRIAGHELDRLGAKSSFLGYRGFPARLCVSVNDEIVHGIPGDRVVNDGDIVSLDVGDIVEGFQADAAVTVGVGKVCSLAQDLMATTQGSLKAGIAAARKGNRLGDISSAIQVFVEARGFSVVREYTGHGIGREMHEDPQVPNFGVPGEGIQLHEGMTLALEPMVNQGTWRTKVGPNKWTVSTADGGLSAHFEHTIVITKGEAEILTML
ncbi:MAG: type I methionyl aminopeptidase [Dehalococcoidia bacterium]|nr:type I methionyl aminopeptidase [Dehalococcoidia bacterium]